MKAGGTVPLDFKMLARLALRLAFKGPKLKGMVLQSNQGVTGPKPNNQRSRGSL